jgi:hypothetical protein
MNLFDSKNCEIEGEGFHAGMPRDKALSYFQLNVNRPDTVFSTDHWLLPKLAELVTLLPDAITSGQARAFDDVLHGRHSMKEFIEWLQSPPMPWADFFAYHEQRERDVAWERWKLRRAQEELSGVFGDRPECCPRCGSRSVLDIVYGAPFEEDVEAARRGAIAMGGCCIGPAANFCCAQCEYRWPEGEIGEAR